MKILKSTIAIHLLAASFLGAAEPAAEPAAAVILKTDKTRENVYVYNVDDKGVKYKNNKAAIDTKNMRKSEIKRVYFIEPSEFKQGMLAFRGRRYKEAMEFFDKVVAENARTYTLTGNYSTLANFYKLECLRKTEQYEQMEKEQKAAIFDALERPSMKTQLELNVLWQATRHEDWTRLMTLVKQWDGRDGLDANHLAQLAFLRGLAHENLGNTEGALNGYNYAMTADYGSSYELVVASFNRALSVYWNDPDVQVAVKNWGTADENKDTRGYLRLLEGNRLAHLFEMTIAASGEGLSEENKNFFKYKDPNAQD